MNTLKLVLKNKDLKKKIVFTLLAFLLYRVAVFITIPMINIPETFFDNDLMGVFNAFSGGALKNFSVVALGVGPYITASIVVQILQMDIVPKISEWAEEGPTGKQKITQLTRYLAIFLAFVQALALTIGITIFDIGVEANPLVFVYLAITITAGTAFLLWLGDQITVKGIGNGVSMIIAAGIISSMPTMYRSLWQTFVSIDTANLWSYTQFAIVVLLMLVVLLAVIYMQAVIRKIPIQYANRGSSQLRGKHDSSVPIKLNSAGVVPVIFAVTLLSLPLTIIGYLNVSGTSLTVMTEIFSQAKPLGFMLYIILIYVFTFFYAFMQINPEKISDNLSKQNAFIPGIRPGEETELYISRVMFKVTLLGALYLAIVASIPLISIWIFNLPTSVQVGGTSLLIVVGVAVETFKQVQTEANKQEYKGFIR